MRFLYTIHSIICQFVLFLFIFIGIYEKILPMPITNINVKFQQINLYRTYYFFSDIKNIDPNLLSINKIYTNNRDVAFYSIKYIMMESINTQNTDGENPLCLSFSDVDTYIIEESGNKYLIFALTEKNKKVIELYKKRWSEIRK